MKTMKIHTPAQVEGLLIAQRGLADELLWLGEITRDEHAALTYTARHAAGGTR